MHCILWGRVTSSNVMKVLWLLDELNLPYERVDVGGPFGGTDASDYRAINPTGLIPTLQEDGFALWESNVILRYLCTVHAPGTPLWPQEPQARATVDQWMDAQQTVLGRHASAVFQGLVRTPPEQRDMAAISQGIAGAASAYGLIDAQLGRHPWIAGEAFTLCDIAWGVHAHRWFNMDFERPPLTHLRAWYDRLLRRPAYVKHVAACPIV